MTTFQTAIVIVSSLFASLCTLASFAGEQRAIRIATVSPLATELVYQLGQQDTIVAGMASPAIEKSRTLLSPGEWYAPSLEKMAHLKVDWVITNEGVVSETFAKGLRSLGIPIFVLAISEWRDVFTESERLMKTVFKKPLPGWFSPLRSCLEKKLRAQKRFTFVALVWGEPPILFGRQTFVSKLLESMGGESITPHTLPFDYPQVSKEWILRQRPDRIYIFDDFLKLRNETWLRAEYWPDRNTNLISIPADYFGRSSFFPLRHIEKLFPQLEGDRCESI